LPDTRTQDLCKYRLAQSEETLQVAKDCLNNRHFKDSINRSYYAAFHAVRAVLALESVDFKRHKDVVAYFNKNYVATGKFDREIGRNLSRLQQIREKCDYNDYFIVALEDTEAQFKASKMIADAVKVFVQEIEQ